MVGFFRSAPRFRLVPFDVSHVPESVAIHADAFHRGWAAHEFAGLLRDPAVIGSVAVDARSGAVLGFVLSRRALDEAEILSIAVSKAARGGGVGAALLKNHLDDLALGGARTVFLEVDETNASALALYRRAGFSRVGERRGYYAGPSGARAAALILRRNL